jgi:hypothetical protein
VECSRRQNNTSAHDAALHSEPSSKGTLAGGKSLARSIQRYHMDHNGWIDSGHNFLNTVGGIVLEGRHGTVAAMQNGQCVRSAHAGNNLANQSPGIENEGLYMTALMPTAQWQSLVRLCAQICQKCGISPNNIKGHRDFSATKCPGDWLYSQIPRLRREVRALLTQ